MVCLHRQAVLFVQLVLTRVVCGGYRVSAAVLCSWCCNTCRPLVAWWSGPGRSEPEVEPSTTAKQCVGLSQVVDVVNVEVDVLR